MPTHLDGGSHAAWDHPRARLPWFWYRIGSAHLRSIRAVDEDAARAAILLANPHARGQRVEISAVRWGANWRAADAMPETGPR
jgi:hypothetical protein